MYKVRRGQNQSWVWELVIKPWGTDRTEGCYWVVPKVSDTWVVLGRRWWDGNVWKVAIDFCTGRTDRWWMCSDLETSEMKPSLQTGQRKLVSMAPFAEMCLLGRQWVAVMTGFRQSARLKGRRRGVVRRGRKTKWAQVTGWDRSSKRG